MLDTIVNAQQRLTVWRNFKKQDLELEKIISYIGSIKTTERAFDYYAPKQWPTGWEIIVNSMYCYSGKALLLHDTLVHMGKLDPKNIILELEELELELIDDGLEELEIDDEAITVYCNLTDFNNMQVKLEELGIEIKNSELQRIPNNFKTITAEQAEKVLKLLDLLEENDDVQQVFHNMELTEEILTAMDSE